MFIDKAFRLPTAIETILFLIGFLFGFFSPYLLTQSIIFVAGKLQTIFSTIDLNKIKSSHDLFEMLAVIVASIFSLILIRRVLPLAWGLIVGVLVKILLSFFGIQLPSLV